MSDYAEVRGDLARLSERQPHFSELKQAVATIDALLREVDQLREEQEKWPVERHVLIAQNTDLRARVAELESSHAFVAGRTQGTRLAVERCCEIANQQVGPDRYIGVYAGMLVDEIVKAIRAEFADVLESKNAKV